MYAPVGGGLLILCQLAIAVPCVLFALLLLASEKRRKQPRYWCALFCFAQPFPIAMLLVDKGPFWPHFEGAWCGSMGMMFLGYVALVVWPKSDSPDGNPAAGN